MSPEVILKQNHGISSDYFALGVIVYECMQGKRPFKGISRQEIQLEIKNGIPQITEQNLPNGWSLQSADFCNKLLQEKPSLRLGYQGPMQIKNHPWLKDFNWNQLDQKVMKAPLIPNIEKKINYIRDDTDIPKEYTDKLKQIEYQKIFENYEYDQNVTKGIETLQHENMNNTMNIQSRLNIEI